MFDSKREDLEKMDPKTKARIDKKIEKDRKKNARKYFFQKLKFRMGDKPMQYKEIEVPDFNDRCRQIRGFREAYQKFFLESLQENSKIQDYSTQMLWHRLYLQKLRLNKLGLTMKMESTRVKRSDNEQESVKEEFAFDGRYQVSEVNESIAASRTFIYRGEEVGAFDNHESVNYYILSAKRQGESEILCPNCGSVSTRENLIDGCDYCGTKFTIEDLEDKVGSFDFQYEFADKETAQKAWDAHRYFSQEARKLVGKFDPNFSMREFAENVFNKVAAIHFADSFTQINAFSDNSLEHLLDLYKNVVNIDPWDIRLSWFDAYAVEDGLQKIKCRAIVTLFEFIDGEIKIRDENVDLSMEKSADCKTQEVCGPSVFKCKGCGQSLSLMDGKACKYCDRELDMRQYDWVITGYESKMQNYRESLYEI